MMNVQEKLERLRQAMAKNHIDYYYIPNEDDHLSQEYTANYFQSKSYISGFTGESGCVIVSQTDAKLWTDGRYFTQAEKELDQNLVELMRLRQAGVLDPLDYLVQTVQDGQTIGFDGRVVSQHAYEFLVEQTKAKHVKIEYSLDLIDEVWQDRPTLPKEPIYLLDEKYTGESVLHKLSRLREKMKQLQIEGMVLPQLEDPCYLFNVRGNDIENTPVAYAFGFVTMEEAHYFIDLDKVSKEVKEALETQKITLHPYEQLEAYLSKQTGPIGVVKNMISVALYQKIQHPVAIVNPVLWMRAVKNEVEIANTKYAHQKDAVAMVEFITWLKKHPDVSQLDEVMVQDHLYDLRQQQKGYIEPSFTTICAYQENGAMMHYSAKPHQKAQLQKRGFLLVDSGGTYFEGTTDITRTIAVGPLSLQEKKWYTLVLKGHLQLSRARFLKGTTGYNLDILARGPLWAMDMDYQCGTGHGVGHVMAVHEGPHGIRWGKTHDRDAILEPGMIVTNEPGVYLPDQLGIRIENELLVRHQTTNFYGDFLDFETITYVPYDLDAIDVQYLNQEDIDQINEYHQMVYALLKDQVSDVEYLQYMTRKLVKE